MKKELIVRMKTIIRACFDFGSFSLVSKSAPDWNGTAVIDGEFKELKLSDFRGIWTSMYHHDFFITS